MTGKTAKNGKKGSSPPVLLDADSFFMQKKPVFGGGLGWSHPWCWRIGYSQELHDLIYMSTTAWKLERIDRGPMPLGYFRLRLADGLHSPSHLLH